MNKPLAIAIMAASLLAASGFAEADDGRRGHHGGYHVSHVARHHYRPAVRHYRGPRHVYRPAYHAGYYRGHHHGRHELRKGLKIAAGALLIGSVIHAATDHRHDQIVVRRRAAGPDYAGDGNFYSLDDDGQCYEVSTNSRGEEVWIWVERGYCN